jgi:ferredoxin
MRPENREIDDRLRGLPELLAPGGRFHDPVFSEYIASLFEALEKLTVQVDGETAPRRLEREPSLMTAIVKGTARRLGADDVGIAELDPMSVYSHVGRGPEMWGAPIENSHRFAVVIALEMDYEHVEAAPRLPITMESAVQYLKGAQISISLARAIRSHGYPARAHIAGSNYQIMLPPVAYDAGLGELGRIGYLISPRFGARIRLGAVTTDMPLVPDSPRIFGVQEFCTVCRKCAVNCPSGAIPRGGKEWVRGVEKWPLAIEKCLHYWRLAGTDCGLCMKVCPYSHPPTFVHNLVRSGIRRSAFARRIAVWGDDLLYGKNQYLEGCGTGRFRTSSGV